MLACTGLGRWVGATPPLTDAAIDEFERKQREIRRDALAALDALQPFLGPRQTLTGRPSSARRAATFSRSNRDVYMHRFFLRERAQELVSARGT